MTVTGTEARYGLTASITPQGVNVSGGLTIGTPATGAIYLTPPNIVYSLAMQIAVGQTLVLNLATGVVTGGLAGVNQVETSTITAAAGCTANGDATVTFASSIITGSPITLSVPLTTAQNTAALVAVAVRSFINSHASALIIRGKYTISGTGAEIVATAISKASNDTILNIAIANGTCTGITTSATSVNTTAGVMPSIAYRINGLAWDVKDAEGIALPLASKLYSSLVRCASSEEITVSITSGNGLFTEGVTPFVDQRINPAGNHSWNGITLLFSADGDVLIYVDIHAGT